MTPLQFYLRSNKITVKAFAKKLGLSQSYVSEISSGRRQPPLDIAIDIEDWSGGQVKVRDLRTRERDSVLSHENKSFGGRPEGEQRSDDIIANSE